MPCVVYGCSTKEINNDVNPSITFHLDNKHTDNLFPKTSRNDRYKQMTKQQNLIEEKKRQIQEKLNQKKKGTEEPQNKEDSKEVKNERKSLVFSNDGSFLDQFKKMSAMTASQTDNLDNGNQNDWKILVSDNNNQNNRDGGMESGAEMNQDHTRPAPLPPDHPPPMSYQQLQQHYHPQQHNQHQHQQQLHLQQHHHQQQPPPHYLPFGVPPPPPPIPPPLIPQSAPPPLIPQSIPPPRPINVQNIPPPPLGLPIPSLPPCFPPQPPLPYQPPHAGPPMHNLLIPPPNFCHSQVPPENVQQGTAQGCMAPGPPAHLDLYPPSSQPPDHCPPNNNNWYPPIQSNSTNNNIPPLMQDQKPEIKLQYEEEFDNQRSHRSIPPLMQDQKPEIKLQYEEEFDNQRSHRSIPPLMQDHKPEIKLQYEEEFDNQRSHRSIPPLMQDHKPEIKEEYEEEFDNQKSHRSDRKRKSRWGDEKEANIPPPLPPVEIVPTVPKINVTGMSGHMLTKVTRRDPGLLQYALTAYGSTILSEEDWKKAEENFKVHLLYQDMMSKRAALEKLKVAGKHKYEYDSDEEIDEKGTWEHKLRDKEMMATQQWAESLTEMAKGKHHIGDFLPPDELKKFMAKYNAAKGGGEPDLSDYKDYKLGEENKGFQMLQKLGWSEGQGLGSDGGGRLDPINKGQMREFNEGLGHTRPDDIGTDDDEYDAYRKRMMLAYRFRPNPLNNPRRPYY